MFDMLDREFGQYRLLRRLGRGGMADVYLARDTSREIDVALKLVERQPNRDSREICEAERRGALLQDQFSRVDPHVPLVHACGERDGFFYIDMEYVDGEDLAERVARGPLTPTEAVWVVSELCDFLRAAHDFEATVDDTRVRGIIHADIKPKNVRLSLTGQLKVLDFGIAKGLSLSRKLTRNDFGSMSYLSPERLDSGEVDIHVDFWSVGVVLYELVAGTTPFDAESNQKLEALIRRREPPPPLPESCPPALSRIVYKLLSGDRRRRYQSAAAIRADLDAFQAETETVAEQEWLAESVAEATRRTVRAPEAGDDGHSGGDESEATRRTTSPGLLPGADDAEATRRTLEATHDAGASARQPDAVPGEGPPPLPGVEQPRTGTGTVQRAIGPIRRWAVLAAATVGVLVLGNEFMVRSEAKTLRVNLATGQASQMKSIWSQYQQLSQRSWLGLGVAGIRTPLRERLVTQAERVMADYRQDEPTVREAQWAEATAWLTNAISLDPGDRKALARLRYCEAHLQRINGEARKRRRQPATQMLHDAVQGFQEAARLDTAWPDPHLGLGRTYIYGLDDVDRAVAAFEEAERRGYTRGNREHVQIADGYRNRAERVRREAAAVRGMPQERDGLDKAAADYRRALDEYGHAIGFGDVTNIMRQVQARLEEVEQRLAELTEDGIV